MQRLFCFLESSALFTALSLFTAVTIGDTEQSSSTMLVACFLDVPPSLFSLILSPHLFANVLELAMRFFK